MDNLLSSGPARDQFFLHPSLAMIQTSCNCEHLSHFLGISIIQLWCLVVFWISLAHPQYVCFFSGGSLNFHQWNTNGPSFVRGASKMGIRSPQNCHGGLTVDVRNEWNKLCFNGGLMVVI